MIIFRPCSEPYNIIACCPKGCMNSKTSASVMSSLPMRATTLFESAPYAQNENANTRINAAENFFDKMNHS